MFDNTRYLTKIILEVTNHMKPFFLLMFIIIFAANIAFYTDSTSAINFYTSWLDTYSISYGAYGNYTLDLEIGIFLVATLFLTLILLNMLVTIIIKIFNRVESGNDIADQQEKAEIILEIESIMFWGRKTGQNKYLQMCSISRTKANKKDKNSGKLFQKNSMNRSKIRNNCVVALSQQLDRIDKKKRDRELFFSFMLEFFSEVDEFKKYLRKEIIELKHSLDIFRFEISNRKTFIK